MPALLYHPQRVKRRLQKVAHASPWFFLPSLLSSAYFHYVRHIKFQSFSMFLKYSIYMIYGLSTFTWLGPTHWPSCPCFGLCWTSLAPLWLSFLPTWSEGRGDKRGGRKDLVEGQVGGGKTRGRMMVRKRRGSLPHVFFNGTVLGFPPPWRDEAGTHALEQFCGIGPGQTAKDGWCCL